MKQIELNIPDSLSEVTLRDYQSIQEYIQTEKDEIKVAIKMISILCGITTDEARGLKKDEFEFISVHLSKVLSKEVIWKQRFKLNGVEYGFIPNLDDITFGEYVDLDTYIRNPKDIHKVISVLYRPIILDTFGKYEIEKYTGKEDTDIMLDAPMDIVNGSMVFFYDLCNELVRSIPQFLERKLQVKQTTQSNQTSEVSGDGTQACIDSLMEDLQQLKKLQKRTSTHV